MREWLVAADDRTGAFEVAALFAQVVGPVTVTVGDAPNTSAVVDIGTRGLAASEAARLAAAIDESPSVWVAHKIDSTLRGNWATELRARRDATGRRVVVLPGWPEMGRTCVGGVVQVNGHPIGNVLDHVGDSDLVRDAGELSAWLDGDRRIATCDVPNSHAMHAAASLLAGRDVLLAGPAGPLGAVFAAGHARLPTQGAVVKKGPVLVVCGSANPVSREQVRRLHVARPDMEIVTTDAPDGELDRAAVVTIAVEARRRIEQVQPRTVFIIGGETAAAVLGDSPRTVFGFAAAGMPSSLDGDGPHWITKAGGFGGPDALVDLLCGENE